MEPDDPRARLKQWLKSGQAKLHPLTHPQRELWETSPVPPSSPANHICSFFEIEGPVTYEHCKAAVDRVVERQEVMRTSFLPGKDRPLQIIRSTGETVLRYRELTETEAQPESLEAIMAEGFREPFDFLRGPLYRLDMLRRGEDDFVLAFTIHHALADGWTLGAFVEDLCTAYILDLQDSGTELEGVRGIRESLPRVPMSYSQWGAAERANWQPSAIEPHADYWKTRLAGSQRLFEKTASTGDKSTPLEKWITSIPKDLTEAIRAIAKQNGATLFSTLLATFQLTIHRWTGCDDLTVGTPVANRNKSAVRETMGYFAGVVPLRGQIDPTRAFSDHLKQVQDDTTDAFSHAIPFAELAALLGETSTLGRHAIFDTRFALQNHPIPDIDLPGVATRLRTRSTGTARFDLGCELTEELDGSLELVWLHRASVVPATDLRELDALFHDTISTVCKNPEVHPRSIGV